MNSSILKSLICTLFLAALATSASAANIAEEPVVDCDNAMTQMDMNICAGRDFMREDDTLNQLYQQLLGKFDNKSRSDVRQIQRSWIQYRDLQCNYEAAQYEGGSIQPMVHSSCLANLTQQRNQILQYMVDQSNQ